METRKSHAARTGRGQPAQTMENLRNYIGFGEANQLRDHQSQPRSSRNLDFRTLDGFLVEVQHKWRNLVILAYFSKIGYFGGQVLK